MAADGRGARSAEGATGGGGTGGGLGHGHGRGLGHAHGLGHGHPHGHGHGLQARGPSLAAACAIAATLLALAPARGQAPSGPSGGTGAGADLFAPPDPFAAGGDLFAPPDPFAEPPGADEPGAAAPEPGAAPSWFDPDAVRLRRPEGLRLPGGVELHGRANLTASYTDGAEGVELLSHASLELSSADLYAEWFPSRFVGLLAEVEVASDLEDTRRELEVEPELLAVEARPLGDDGLRLRLGLFPVPFGLERRHYAPPRNELATRPAAFRRVFPGTYADWGLMLWERLRLGGLGSEVELEVALTRGLEGPLRRGDRPAVLERDENEEPQLTGRLGWTLLDLAPGEDAPLRVRLALGASLLAGHHDDRARERVRASAYDVAVTLGDLTARVEVVSARAELGAGPRRERSLHGLYAVVAWRRHFEDVPLVEEAYVAVRYDRADPDTRARDAGDSERYHVGLGWVPCPGVLVKVGAERARELDARVWTTFAEVGYAF